jgi:hypothetical protein
MNFLREKASGLNLRETTARLSQNANEWREKLQATSSSLDFRTGNKDDPDGGDSKLDSISLTDIKTDEKNSNGGDKSRSEMTMEQNESSTQQTNKDTPSVLTSVTALIEAAKAQQEQYMLDIANPEVVVTMQQIQTLKNDLKALRQTNRDLKNDRTKDLGSINKQKNAMGRDLWLKMQNNKMNPYVLKDYREELVKLSLPEHDKSNPTLTAETKLLRAQHNEWMTDRQMAIVHKFQQSMIDYMYNDALPSIKQENEAAIAALHDQLDKTKQLKAQVEKVYQSRAQIQGAILAEYKIQDVPAIPEIAKSAQLSYEANNSFQTFQESDSDFSLFTRKGKAERSSTQKTLTLKSAGFGENKVNDGRLQNESMTSVAEIDLQGLSEIKIDYIGKVDESATSLISRARIDSINPSKEEEENIVTPSTTSPSQTPARSNMMLSNGTSNLDAPSLILSPQLSPRTGMAARIAERRRASAQQQQPSGLEKVGNHTQPSSRSTTATTSLNDEDKLVHRSDPTTSNSSTVEDGVKVLQSQKDEIQRLSTISSMTDRRSVGGRMGTTGRTSRSGLLERARSARLQGATIGVHEGNDTSAVGATSGTTTTTIATAPLPGNSTIGTARPTLTRHRSLSTRDVGGTIGSNRPIIRPTLSSSSSTNIDGRTNSRRNLLTGSLSSRHLNGNGEIPSSRLSEDRRAEIRNQLRNSVSKGNTVAVSNGVKVETTTSATTPTSRPSVTRTPSKRFERVTDESDEEL